MTARRSPAGLAADGRRLWRSITGVYDLDPREGALLEAACRQADVVGRLEAAMVKGPLTVTGSQGQPVVNGMLTEARQGRATMARLLGQLGLPDAGDRPMTARSQRAQKAAQSRWKRTAAVRELRRGPVA